MSNETEQHINSADILRAFICIQSCKTQYIYTNNTDTEEDIFNEELNPNAKEEVVLCKVDWEMTKDEAILNRVQSKTGRPFGDILYSEPDEELKKAMYVDLFITGIQQTGRISRVGERIDYKRKLKVYYLDGAFQNNKFCFKDFSFSYPHCFSRYVSFKSYISSCLCWLLSFL